MKSSRLSLTFSCIAVMGLNLFVAMESFGQQTKGEQARIANRSRRAARSLASLASNGGGSLLGSEFASATVNDKLLEWLKQNEKAIVGAAPSPFLKSNKWGGSTTNDNQLYLLLSAWPKSGKLTIPRLHNSIKIAKLIHSGEEIKVKPNVQDWELTLPKKPKPRETLLPVVAIELDGPVVLGQTPPPVVKPSEDGSIVVHARYSVVHGEMLRFEPQAHKNCVGFWVKQDDWVEWRFEADPEQVYEVVLRYGCGNGQGGSDVDITLGGKNIPFQVEQTGGFQAWREVSLGKIDGFARENKLIVKPKKKAKNAVMDIQQIILKPIGK